MKNTLFATLAAAVMAGGFAVTATPAAAQNMRASEARIPFVQYGGIRDWRTDRDDSLFVQDGYRHWYRVQLMGPCVGLEFASRVRFLPSDGAGTFDRFSWINADGARCKVQSVQQIRGEPDVRNHPRPRDRS
ncbi:MAG: hypothetical protein K1X51_09220 [Rhodospirillaceae bacterium]|nr:hypothetical protein [Rhodospirillaceae bacterium]